jgi:hypothetical protein
MGKLAAALPVLGSVLGGVGSVLGPIGTIAGAVSSANSLMNKPKAPRAPAPAQAPSFDPKRPDAMGRPGSLSGFDSFTPEQERSALATRGVNQGLSKDEDGYYRNLVQRSLIGDNNQPAADTNSLLPVESQYFSQQGMNTSGIMDFLKQLSGAQ